MFRESSTRGGGRARAESVGSSIEPRVSREGQDPRRRARLKEGRVGEKKLESLTGNMAEVASARPPAVDMALVAEDEPQLKLPENTLLRRERPDHTHVPADPTRRTHHPPVSRDTLNL